MRFDNIDRRPARGAGQESSATIERAAEPDRRTGPRDLARIALGMLVLASAVAEGCVDVTLERVTMVLTAIAGALALAIWRL